MNVMFLYEVNTDIYYSDCEAFCRACKNIHVNIIQWYIAIDVKIFLRHIGKIEYKLFERIFSNQHTIYILRDVIVNNSALTEEYVSQIEILDDIVIHAICYYDMIDELLILEKYFSYISYEIGTNGKITSYDINKKNIKSARNI